MKKKKFTSIKQTEATTGQPADATVAKQGGL